MSTEIAGTAVAPFKSQRKTTKKSKKALSATGAGAESFEVIGEAAVLAQFLAALPVHGAFPAAAADAGQDRIPRSRPGTSTARPRRSAARIGHQRDPYNAANQLGRAPIARFASVEAHLPAGPPGAARRPDRPRGRLNVGFVAAGRQPADVRGRLQRGHGVPDRRCARPIQPVCHVGSSAQRGNSSGCI